MDLKKIYQLFINSGSKIVIDSRLCKAGDIFFGLKGDNLDGNQYAKKSLESGCLYAVIDNPKYYLNEKTILVEDCLFCLQELSKLHRKNLKTPILAITGSNGKTTTKELIVSVLQKKFNLGYTKGNYNNHIGLPLTLLSFSKETEFGVVEMGANHPGEIDALCKIANPEYGLITNIGKAHIEGFGSFQGVIDTKNELYSFLNSKNGLIFYNSNNQILESLKKNNKLGFGNQNDSISGKTISASPFLKIEVSINNSEKITINSNLFGEYNLENILAAISIGKYFGVKTINIKEALESYKPDNNRSQIYKTEKNTLFLDAYNANPSSMENALNNFISLSGKKALILGDMLELGSISIAEHKNIIDYISSSGIEKIFLVGKIFYSLKSDKFLCFENVDNLINHLSNNKVYGYNILIKGSRGINLEKAIPYL